MELLKCHAMDGKKNQMKLPSQLIPVSVHHDVFTNLQSNTISWSGKQRIALVIQLLQKRSSHLRNKGSMQSI